MIIKKIVLFFYILVCAWILTSCSLFYTKTPTDLLRETWPCQINTNPAKWLQGVDPWFLTGESRSEEACKSVLPRKDISTRTSVQTPDFVSLSYNGPYELQIIGQQSHNSVSITGPYSETRQISMNVQNQTLYIEGNPQYTAHQPTYSPFYRPPVYNPSIKKVRIRIGVTNLRSLTNKGCGNIYVRDITSPSFSLSSFGRGNIMLVGHVNLQRVQQMGSGSITVFGATTPALNIRAVGNGNVNISGRVGVQTITHQGNGEINVIGANTNCLNIIASGNGRTIVSGIANVKQICAKDCSQVYVCSASSYHVAIIAKNAARIGVAGRALTLNATLRDSSRFEGQSLRTCDTYIHAYDCAHANISADQKIFATASNNSSIYYLGSANISRFACGNAVIIPVMNNSSCCNSLKPCPSKKLTYRPRPLSLKGERFSS